MESLRRKYSKGSVANFVHFPAVKELWKSVEVLRSYSRQHAGSFFRHRVYYSYEDALTDINLYNSITAKTEQQWWRRRAEIIYDLQERHTDARRRATAELLLPHGTAVVLNLGSRDPVGVPNANLEYQQISPNILPRTRYELLLCTYYAPYPI